MNPFANIICSRARIGTDPDLIARERTSATFKHDWIQSSEHCCEPALECSISIQDFRARLVCTENRTPRLECADHDMLLERHHESRRHFFYLRHQRFPATSGTGVGPHVPTSRPPVN